MQSEHMTLFGPVQILPADRRHQGSILRLQRAAIDNLPAGLYEPALRESWWRTPTRGLDALIEAGRYFVAALDDYLVAGAGWSPGDAPDTALVRAVYTDPDFVGFGFGKYVMLHTEKTAFAEGYSRMVVPAALNAVGFYARLGYQPEGMDEADFGNNLRFPYQEMSKELIQPASIHQTGDAVC